MFGKRRTARPENSQSSIQKKNILDAWIMVEHLAEGDVSSSSAKKKSLRVAEKEDYASLFQSELQKIRSRKGAQRGIVVRLGIFPFSEVIDILRKKFSIGPTQEDVNYSSHKFSIALYFDDKLTLLPEMTFVTASCFIRENRTMPDLEEFRKFEKELKEKVQNLFESAEGNPEAFNSALRRIIHKFKGTDTGRFEAVASIETDTPDLHSFFIEDLLKAEQIQSDSLDAYLGLTEVRHQSLDVRPDSSKYAPDLVKEWLKPLLYPLGRFPSSLQFSLSLMQQAAVNIAINGKNALLQSVNGPPGTGKTTLLKDIFAHLCIMQAWSLLQDSQMGKLKTRMLEASDGTKIQLLPQSVQNCSILVASTNNGAVQNIVSELPLKSSVDEAFYPLLQEADYFPEIASAVLNEPDKEEQEPKEFWGLFSMEGGRASNMSRFRNALEAIANTLQSESSDYPAAKEAFLDLYVRTTAALAEKQRIYKSPEQNRLLMQKQTLLSQIQDQQLECAKAEDTLKQELSKQKKAEQAWIQQETELEKTCDSSKGTISVCEAGLQNQNIDPNLLETFKKTLQIHRETLIQTEKRKVQIGLERKNLKNSVLQHESRSSRLRKELVLLQQKLKQLDSDQPAAGLDFSLPYPELQLSNPWSDEPFRLLQTRLFAASLRLRRQFLQENQEQIRAALKIWNDQEKYAETPGMITAAWHWISLCIPAISTTFASLGRMAKHLPPASLGYVFVDEAGQALPQAAVGAVFRSRKIIMVGDPSQIPPVLTLDSKMLETLSKHFGVKEKHLSFKASAQTLCDAASPLGFDASIALTTKGDSEGKRAWIGIPLWVHRRCRYPMFSISNAIIYGGNMVQGVPKDGRAWWYDITGKANDKYVTEQGEFLEWKLRKMIAENPGIGKDGEEEDTVFVISPFRNVASKLALRLSPFFTRYKNGKPSNVGTVHTFQGKEAPIVFLVLGADSASAGAASWAVQEPNILNVAATRAKKEFYIIGELSLYRKTGSDPVKHTLSLLKKFSDEHPQMRKECQLEKKTFYEEHPLLCTASPSPFAKSTGQDMAASSLSVTAGNSDPVRQLNLQETLATVTRVRLGRTNKYAYLQGKNGEQITIHEGLYPDLVPEDNLQEGMAVRLFWKTDVKNGKICRRFMKLEILA